MHVLNLEKLSVVNGGRDKTAEWMSGFCLGVSIGGFLTAGLAGSKLAAYGMGLVGIACDI